MSKPTANQETLANLRQLHKEVQLQLGAKMQATVDDRYPLELARGWLRYEALRKLTPVKYTALSQLHLNLAMAAGAATPMAFDELVDLLVMEKLPL